MCKDNIINIQNSQTLDWDRVETLKDNAMLKVKPELWAEWDFEKNDGLGFDVWGLTYGSRKKVWWLCPKCKSSYDMLVKERTTDKQNCPYCVGSRVNHTNSLASLNPTLAKEWHPTKNKKTPHEVTAGSSKKAWWLGECDHEWEAAIKSRNLGRLCPFCYGVETLVGFNDMWTTDPEQAKLLLHSEDGYKYRKSSNVRVDWKCFCGFIIRDKSINKIADRGLSCPKCKDGVSYPEKIMINLLNSLGVFFVYQKTFEWSNSKRYDFYITSLKIIIETHGKQHYEEYDRGERRTLEEEQANDKYKHEMAIANGIEPENYIVIDCRRSNLNWIKNSILNSRLAELFDLSGVDWKEIHKQSITSIVRSVCKDWNDGEHRLEVLARKYSLHTETIRRYLKNNNINVANSEFGIHGSAYKVVQLDEQGNFIKIWKNSREIREYYNIISGSIFINPRLKNEKKLGFKFMYLHDYEAQNKNNTI